MILRVKERFFRVIEGEVTRQNDLLDFLKGIYYWKLLDHRLASLTFSSNI